MKVLICGGRDYVNKLQFWKAMAMISEGRNITTVISGGARGADTLGEMWAKEKGFTLEKYPAQWNKHGKSAGPIHNKEMLHEGKPDLVVAFGGGRGTDHMVSISKAEGFQVIEVNRDE